MENYNVLNEKWMPVINQNGKKEYVSPRDIFTQNYRDFSGDAIENYCMLKFCCALVHSSDGCQPCSVGEWKSLRNAFNDAVIDYMDSHLDLFWVRGEKAFLQCTETEIDTLLGKGDWRDIQLREHYAVNNNSLIRNTQLTRYVSWGDVVLDLLVHQTHSVTFGKTIPPPSRSMMYGKSTDGNLNIYLSADNITDSIWLNLNHGCEFGRPVWETGFDQDTVGSYLSRLIPLTVRIRISDDMMQMKYCRGLSYHDDVGDSSHLIPTTYQNKKETVQRPMKTKQNMRFWQEFSSVINGSRPTQLKREFDIDVFINTIGANYKFSMGNYYTESITQSSYYLPNPRKIDNPSYIKFYSRCVISATTIAESLGRSMYFYFSETYPKDNPKERRKRIDGAMSTYWNVLDMASTQLFTVDGTQEDAYEWNCTMLNAINALMDSVEKTEGVFAWRKVNESNEIKTAIYELTKPQ